MSDDEIPDDEVFDECESDDDWGYDSEDHVRALRLIMAALRRDWVARDEVLTEIGDCPGCWARVAVMLAGEAATAYVGPPEETPEGGFSLNEGRVEKAIDFIGEILADVLDARAE